jgi:hypothetical protein
MVGRQLSAQTVTFLGFADPLSHDLQHPFGLVGMQSGLNEH